MIRLPANVTPDSVVISMYLDSVESKNNLNSNCPKDSNIVNVSTSEKSIKLECSEDTDTVTVFEGNVVLSSDVDITSLSKIPLVVFSDKTEIAAVNLIDTKHWNLTNEKFGFGNLILTFPK
ncbi:uncharacterized protein LOC123293830 [Chrysoperla carnea]|uniref:uncharacterized protein LOC123293830 n=1 Tax=Chrysoperla carnea TaxID=189513 RepID=UPI001D081CAC|nr:uncharacterized protein LOC123293830 [Chrysoperla carnea]